MQMYIRKTRFHLMTPGKYMDVQLGSIFLPSRVVGSVISNVAIIIAKDMNKELSAMYLPGQILRPYPNTTAYGSGSGSLPFSARNLSGLNEKGSE